MNMTIEPAEYSGTVSAIVSKSHVHRLLICSALAGNAALAGDAAFADKKTRIKLGHGDSAVLSEDIKATIDCLTSLGAEISYDSSEITVIPVSAKMIPGQPANNNTRLDCRESGSTLRFLLPVAAALGVNAEFYMGGRLPLRPLSPLYEEMRDHGCKLSPAGSNPLCISGKMTGGVFTVAGNISSQYMSGLLFSLPLLESGGEIVITGERESQSYIDMTVACMRDFGVSVCETECGYIVRAGEKYTSPGEITAEGDWSNGAFWLTLGAVSKNGVTCENLNTESIQGDKRIAELLKSFGAEVKISGNSVSVKRGVNGIKAPEALISASEIPDLVPVLSVIASVCGDEVKITDAGRLRMKESDRISAVADMIKSLGGDITAYESSLVIRGTDTSLLAGGTVDGYNDHRIVMSAAIASAVCLNPVKILDAGAVKKSYPTFFDELEKLRIKK